VIGAVARGRGGDGIRQLGRLSHTVRALPVHGQVVASFGHLLTAVRVGSRPVCAAFPRSCQPWTGVQPQQGLGAGASCSNLSCARGGGGGVKRGRGKGGGDEGGGGSGHGDVSLWWPETGLLDSQTSIRVSVFDSSRPCQGSLNKTTPPVLSFSSHSNRP
jgi:hypothetical protein